LLLLQWAVRNQVLTVENLKLTFDPVESIYVPENDETALFASIREVIELDAPVVVSSGNIDVSLWFLRPATVIDTSCDRND